MMKLSYPKMLISVWLSVYTIPILAHTWVESVNLIASDGTFAATGYSRAFGGRIPGVDPDKVNTYLLPPNGRATGNEILATDLMCKDTQRSQNQSPGFPRLSAAPEDHISLAYHENGHVTMFSTNEGKPAGRGTVFIYGTNEASPADTYLGIHRVWNPDGSGGDKRGRLLATRPFDDGHCFQINDEKLSSNRAKALGFTNIKEAPEILCQSVLQLPKDAGIGKTYTLYWVWEWPTLDSAGSVFKNESYTSCIDIDMVAKPITHSSKLKGASKADVNSVAVKDQLQDNQFVVDPSAPAKKASDNPFTKPGKAPAPVKIITDSPSATTESLSAVTESIPTVIQVPTDIPISFPAVIQVPTEVPVSFVTVTTTIEVEPSTITIEIQPTSLNRRSNDSKDSDSCDHKTCISSAESIPDIKHRAVRGPW